MYKWANLICAVLLFTCSCRKAFTPAGLTSSPNKYLVIDGIINSGTDSTLISLSRTQKIDSNAIILPETGARITVESDGTGNYPLVETIPGTYVSAGLNLDASHKYRLHIKTTNSEEYLSDYVAVKNAPPIDSISFAAKPAALQISVTSHDDHNLTKYYRWNYTEAWQFHTTYRSYYNGTTERQDSSDYINYCFGQAKSSTIILGTTTQLKSDLIYQAPITAINPNAEKLELRYSILVKEYALSGDAYNFWKNLQKNNEQRGSIFDAQPTDNQTNYHCVNNPLELVVGYLSVGSYSSKRIYIDRRQLPSGYHPAYPFACQIDTTFYEPPKGTPIYFPDPSFTSIDALFYSPVRPFNLPNALTYSTSDCVDCRTRGTLAPPVFWQP